MAKKTKAGPAKSSKAKSASHKADKGKPTKSKPVSAKSASKAAKKVAKKPTPPRKGPSALKPVSLSAAPPRKGPSAAKPAKKPVAQKVAGKKAPVVKASGKGKELNKKDTAVKLSKEAKIKAKTKDAAPVPSVKADKKAEDKKSAKGKPGKGKGKASEDSGFEADDDLVGGDGDDFAGEAIVEVAGPRTQEREIEEEVILTDAEGRRYCRVRDCDQVAMVDGYCRYHYLLFWKKIQVRKKILTEGKLERYIEELTARYPDKYLDMLRKDLKSEKDFVAAIQELEIDDSTGEGEFEDEAQSYIDEVRGMSDSTPREEEDY